MAKKVGTGSGEGKIAPFLKKKNYRVEPHERLASLTGGLGGEDLRANAAIEFA